MGSVLAGPSCCLNLVLMTHVHLMVSITLIGIESRLVTVDKRGMDDKKLRID